MINHTAVLLALRTHLLTLSVCTTGSANLSATTTGYERTTGSFIDDGFMVGMEVAPSGFVVTMPRVITSVTELTLTVGSPVTPENADDGRTLAVGLPVSRAYENVDFTPIAGSPYLSEQYLPGPAAKATLGAFGEIEMLPMYLPRVFVPANTGRSAVSRYADAVLNHFTPETSIAIADGSLRVRGDVAPFPGQLLNTENGFAVIPITVPLRYRTTNSI